MSSGGLTSYTELSIDEVNCNNLSKRNILPGKKKKSCNKETTDYIHDNYNL